jgi:PAS domain S-box-containing protein
LRDFPVVAAAVSSERARRESEDHFRQVFEHAPIGVALIGLDGRYQRVNPALCALTGYSESQFQERLTVADLTYPDDVAADEANLARLLAGEVTAYTVEKRYLTAAGEVRWGVESSSLVHGNDGAPLRLIAQVQDITERKDQERLLADERRRLREAQAVGHVGSWESDLRTGEVSWSESLFELYGTSPALFENDYEAAVRCVHPDDRPILDESRKNTVRTGEPSHIRYRVIRANDGALRWFEGRGAVQRENGQVVRLTGSVADVTEQVLAKAESEQARDDALEASRQKSAFLAMMSHEIRTPMNAVIGMTDLLVDTNLDDEQREFVDTVRSSGDNLLAIINDILDYSKIEAGQLTLESEVFDMRECVESAMELVAATSGANAVELMSQLSDDCALPVLGDVTRLRQVLVNLLRNAVKFTSVGDVLLSVESEPASVGQVGMRFLVTDTGIGIPADRLADLFRAFSQVDASTTRVYGGSGLGLTITQRLVEAMGGELTVESELGAGSTFGFSIALNRPTSTTADAPRVSSPASLSGRGALVVDDNVTNRRILRLQLERWGMSVVESADATETMKLIASGINVDIAILDMRMPGTSGHQLAAMIHAVPDLEHLPLVLLTSLGDRPNIQTGPIFAAFLTKPVKLSRLADTIRRVLEQGPEAGLDGSEEIKPPIKDTTAKLRILLAEDNPINQLVAQLMLAKLGHHVDIVANGSEAVEAVNSGHYDVVLMDVQMPVMDGLEATATIRRLPDLSQPRIVAMTASALDEDRRACLLAGMDAYITKPVRSDALAASLTDAADPTDSGK